MTSHAAVEMILYCGKQFDIVALAARTKGVVVSPKSKGLDVQLKTDKDDLLYLINMSAPIQSSSASESLR